MIRATVALSGYVAGAVWRRMFADRGFGCLHLVFLSILCTAWLVLTWLFVGAALVAASDEGLPNALAFSAVIYWPAAITGGTIARRRRHRTAVSRRRRVTQASGTHSIPDAIRTPVPAPSSDPAPPSTFDDRPLPTPFDPSGRVPGSTGASPPPLAPPTLAAPPPPPPPSPASPPPASPPPPSPPPPPGAPG